MGTVSMFLILWYFIMQVFADDLHYRVSGAGQHLVPVFGRNGHITFTATSNGNLSLALLTKGSSPYYIVVFGSENGITLTLVTQNGTMNTEKRHVETDPMLSQTEERSFWLLWSPYEVSAGHGLTVGSDLMASVAHFDAKENVYQIGILNGNGQRSEVSIRVDGKQKSGFFEESRKEMIPTFSYYKSLERKGKMECAAFCMQGVGCVAFAVVPLTDGQVTCFLHNNRPPLRELKPEAGAETMSLTKIMYT